MKNRGGGPGCWRKKNQGPFSHGSGPSAEKANCDTLDFGGTWWRSPDHRTTRSPDPWTSEFLLLRMRSSLGQTLQYQIYGNASKLVGYATHPDGSLSEVTRVQIPYNSPQGLAGF
jgi:hypothetical protein